MPSVLSMATHRTVRSPSSCATSSTRVRSASRVCSAFWMNGSSPSNWTSTTAPITWVTRPTMLLAILLYSLNGLWAYQSASAPEMISISSLVMFA